MKRCDNLPLKDANPSKVRALLDLLAAFRAAAPDVAADQWRRFFEAGPFAKMVSAKAEAASPRLAGAKGQVGAQRLQMLRFQVVGQLDSFMGNWANEFRDMVLASSLDEATRHQLLTVNQAGAWFSREPVVMRSGPTRARRFPKMSGGWPGRSFRRCWPAIAGRAFIA